MIIILSDCNNKERCKVLMVKILQDMINDANKKENPVECLNGIEYNNRNRKSESCNKTSAREIGIKGMKHLAFILLL